MAKRSKLSIIEKHLPDYLKVETYQNIDGFHIYNGNNHCYVIPSSIKKEHIQTFIQKNI